MVIDLKLKLIHVECEGPKKSLKPKVKRDYYNSSRFGKVRHSIPRIVALIFMVTW